MTILVTRRGALRTSLTRCDHYPKGKAIDMPVSVQGRRLHGLVQGRRLHGLMVCAVVAAALLFAAPVAFAHYASPPVFPPSSHPYGKSYGEWSAAWWQQTMAGTSAPFAGGPVNCAALGTPQVVFLVGTTGGTVSRSCTIPSGRALLMPLINAECSTLEGNGTTESELRACAVAAEDPVAISSLHASVDGQSIANLGSFRFASPLFTFTSSGNNVFGIPAGTTQSVADGYWIMVPPLRPGTHTVSFGGAAPVFNFTTDAEYTITIGKHSCLRVVDTGSAFLYSAGTGSRRL